MATTPTRTTRKRATKTTTARKTAHTPSTTQVVAKRVGQTGRQAGRALSARSRQVAQFISEHPKLAASLAAGIITVGSALLARKLQAGPARARLSQAQSKLVDAVQGLVKH